MEIVALMKEGRIIRKFEKKPLTQEQLACYITV